MRSWSKASNNAIVVRRLYYIDTLKSELSTAKTYELISTDKSQSSINIAVTLKLSLQLVLLRAKKNFPHFSGYQNFINDLTKLVSSQTLAHVQLRVCLKY